MRNSSARGRSLPATCRDGAAVSQARSPRKVLAALVAVAGLNSCLAPAAFGWSRVGHQTVALIAEHRLSPATAKQVRAILGPGISLADISACADNIKRRPIKCADSFQVARNPASRKQHYINISIKDSPDMSSIMTYCRIHGNARVCIIDQIEDGLAVLKDSDATRAQKQIALMFIVHFVGDLHQPLHNAFEVDAKGRGDGGGNGADVWFMQSPRAKHPMNLHHVWDNMLETDSVLKKTGAPEYAKRLEATISKDEAAKWLSVDSAGAALESFEIAKTVIYPAYHARRGERLAESYQDEMQPVAFLQVQKAGVRLAAMLDAALSSP